MRKITEAWFQAAHEDCLMAQKAMEIKLWQQVCFHSQQCAEKGLKAVIVYQSRYPPDVGLLPYGEPTKEDATEHWKSPREFLHRARS